MRARQILERLCEPCRSLVHPYQFEAVLNAAAATFRAARLTLTGLGRASGGAPKHDIKKLDRLIGNPRLAASRHIWFSAIARALVGGVRRPVVCVDWTQIHGPWWALVAAVPFHGRAIPIYAIVARKKRFRYRSAHIRFIVGLREVFGPGVHPILVADAGFRTPFFLLAEEYGFHFVIRVRSTKGVAERWRPDERVSFRALFAKAGKRPRCLGRWVPYASSRISRLRLVIAGRPPVAKRRLGGGYYQKRAQEPWLLATSLSQLSATKIVRIYATRMQIEETFRDAKSPRFGWSLEHSMSRCHHRLEVLIMLGSLAHAAATMAGAAAEQVGLHRRYQANTVTRRRVLSFVRLGREVLVSQTNPLTLAQTLIEVPERCRKLHVQLTVRPTTRHRTRCRECRRGG